MSSTVGASTKRQKLIGGGSSEANEPKESASTTSSSSASQDEATSKRTNNNNSSRRQTAGGASSEPNNFGVDVDDLTDDTDSDDDDELDDEDAGLNGSSQSVAGNHVDIQEQLAAAGPAGVAAAAAIATARKRKRPHTFETNPSVRKRQQTRLIRKLRACIDEYTMRVGQQAVVLITMPGKTAHNFKVFGAQPLESVIRACKAEIMVELEAALLEQAPQQFKDDSNKHELPALVIDGIPTPVEKMTQAQLRAFIPLMLKYSTGRGKPGWGKDSTRPPWWPETLPWANVRSDARDESEKQRISWTTTLRQIVTNCYKYHGRDDLLPIFDENEEAAKQQREQEEREHQESLAQGSTTTTRAHRQPIGQESRGAMLGRAAGVTRAAREAAAAAAAAAANQSAIYTTTSGSAQAGFAASNFVHTISNGDGTFSLIQVDPANAQILTLPDGTQVRAVRLQTLGGESICGPIGELQEATSAEISAALQQQQQQSGREQQSAEHHQQQQQQQHYQHQDAQQLQAIAVSEANIDANGQIIVTGEDGTQSCYPVSQLVSIPASMYQQFAQGGQQLSIVTADGQTIPAEAISIHSIQPAEPEAAGELPTSDAGQQVQAATAAADEQQQQSEAATESQGEQQTELLLPGEKESADTPPSQTNTTNMSSSSSSTKAEAKERND